MSNTPELVVRAYKNDVGLPAPGHKFTWSSPTGFRSAKVMSSTNQKIVLILDNGELFEIRWASLTRA